MPGYSGKKVIEDKTKYRLDCAELNAVLGKKYDQYYQKRKEQGIIEKYNKDRINVDTLTIEDFLIYDLNPQIIFMLLDFYMEYRPSYLPTVLDDGKLSQDDIEYLLMKRPDSIKYFNKKSVEFYNVKNIVLKNPDKYVYGDLPSILSSDPDIKAIFEKKDQVYRFDGRDQEGYDENWLNEAGELKEWFKFSTGYKPKTKQDYIAIFNKYIGSDTTVPGFCGKYKISSTSDFSKFLDRLSIENKDNAQLIKEQLNRSQNRFWLSVVELSKGLSSGEILLSDFIKDNNSDYISYEMISDCIRGLGGINYKEVMYNLSEQLYEYIMDNEYSLNIYSLSKFFKSDYVSDPKKPNSTDLSKAIRDFLINDGYSYNHERPANDYYKAINIISTYNKKYNPETDVLFTSMNVGDKNVEVTQKHRDQLKAYLEINKLPFTTNLAFHYLKEIVKGNIDYSEEEVILNESKEEEQKKLQEGIESCKAAGDYFNLVESLDNEKLKKKYK
mgnify:CR=1 FL=1